MCQDSRKPILQQSFKSQIQKFESINTSCPRMVLAQRPNPRGHHRGPRVNRNMIFGEYRLTQQAEPFRVTKDKVKEIKEVLLAG